MATAVLKRAARAKGRDPKFRSGKELREVLDALLSEIDGDPEFGPNQRAANLPHSAV